MLPTRLLLESTVSFIRTRILLPAGTVIILWAQADPVTAMQTHSTKPAVELRRNPVIPFVMVSLLLSRREQQLLSAPIAIDSVD
jgi:hypothetical protein